MGCSSSWIILWTGHRQEVHTRCTFYEGDIRDKEFLRGVLQKQRGKAVSTLREPR